MMNNVPALPRENLIRKRTEGNYLWGTSLFFLEALLKITRANVWDRNALCLMPSHSRLGGSSRRTELLLRGPSAGEGAEPSEGQGTSGNMATCCWSPASITDVSLGT